MIRCWKCKTEKPEEQFNWENKSLGKRKRICRSCMKTYHQKWFRELYKLSDKHQKHLEWQRTKIKRAREWVQVYLRNHPCIKCGFTNPIALDFDHIDKSGGYNRYTRVFALKNRGYSIARLEEEISKCQVLCANCHRIKTAEEQGWYKNLHWSL